MNERDEIYLLKTNKPNFSERRKVIDEPEQFDEEEKKIEETRHSSSVKASASKLQSSGSTDSADSITSVNSTNSSDSLDIVGDIHQVESTADIDDNDATIDISADSVSLFSRLLTITNKNGAASGTVAVNLSNNRIENDEDENKVITPTILQNGRPVSA